MYSKWLQLLSDTTSKKGIEMTETTEVNVEEALKLIDAGLGRTMSRELMSTNEVTDLLLDVRSVLAAAADTVDAIDEPVAAPIG